MTLPDRADQQQLAIERKKALVAKLPWMRKRADDDSTTTLVNEQAGDVSARAMAADAQKTPARFVPTPPPDPKRGPPQEAQPASLGMSLWADDAVTELKAASAIEGMAGQMLHAAQTGTPRLLLLWPGSLRSLGLAHAVACAARWHQGDKQGIRTLLYPAKANFLQALDHAHLDRPALVNLAQKLVETSPNSAVTVSLAAKDPFWMALNSVSADASGEIHPSLAELLPHFFADKDFESWRACDGDLLRYVKARIADIHHRRALSSLSIPALSDLEKAPDAIFAMSWKASQDDIRQALRALRGGRSPDVLLLDATRALRKDNPSWKSSLVKFLDCAWDIWSEGIPPVLIVTDEPHTRAQLWKELERRARKQSEAAKWLLSSGLPLKGAVCSVGWDGLLPVHETEPLQPEPRKIILYVTDTEAASVIEGLARLRMGVTAPDLVRAISDAAVYLARLAALPSSTRVLTNWLNETDVPMAVRQDYAWPVYKSKLEAVRNAPMFSERDRLDRLIQKGDELWHNYENGTPLARRLADLIEERTRGTDKVCLVFTKPTAKRLAERYFETYDGYPEGAGFEILRDNVRFVVSRTLDSGSDPPSGETLIFVGLDEVSLRLLVLDPRISQTTYVLLTRRNAAYLKATIKAIRALPGFTSLTARLDTIWEQLPDFPDIDEHTLYRQSDFVLPTFSFEQGLVAVVNDHDEHDPNAWELTLENGTTVRRSPNARAYLYDPSLAHTSTRGFKGVAVESLQEGDRLFVMSLELRELTEAALKEAGVPISHDRRFESDLREYHKRVSELGQRVAGVNLQWRASKVHRNLVEELGRESAPPTEGTVRNWLDVDRFRDRTFEDAQPGAPRKEAHFNAFAKVIGMDDFEAVYFWKAVIQPLRGVRRADGRRVSDVYAEMLLEPECTVVHRRLKPEVVRMLFARARENVHSIEAIRMPQEGQTDE